VNEQPKVDAAAAELPTKIVESAVSTDESEIERFYTSYERFLVNSAATEAALRAQSLIDHSKSLRAAVNAHFQLEGERAVKKAGKQHGKFNVKNPNHPRDAIEDAVAKVGFARPLVVFTVLRGDGAWTEARALQLGSRDEKNGLDSNAGGKIEDVQLVDRKSLDIALKMATAGATAFILIADALERTSKQIICRHVSVCKVLHNIAANASTPAKRESPEQRIATLVPLTRIEATYTWMTIEDMRSKRDIAHLIREKMLKSKKPLDPTLVSMAPLPDDERELLATKQQKALNEIDLNKHLDSLRIEASNYQNYAVTRNTTQMLIDTLTRYEKILEHVEAEVKLGHTEPTVVTLTCKSAEIDESNYRTTYCRLADVRQRLADAKKAGEPTQRFEMLLARAGRPRGSASAADQSSASNGDTGADALILEIINYGVGLVMGVTSTSVSYVPNALELLPTVRGYREVMAQKVDDRPAFVKTAGVAEANHFDIAEAELINELEKLAKDNEKSKQLSADQWNEFKEKSIAEFKERIEAFSNKQTTASTSSSTTTTTAATNDEQPLPSGAPFP